VSELMAAGVEITVIGMGVVFVLLTLLVFVVQAMSRFAHLVGGGPAEQTAAAAPSDTRMTAAITAAIHAYRARRKR
jgi:oxaloacetate decarboxylase gamma subunit